jgi:hypothetical protein
VACRNGHADNRNALGRCRECARACSLRWKAAHPGREAQLHREWLAAHPGATARYLREWRIRNPERSDEQHARWRRDNPDRVAAHAAVRRAVSSGRLKAEPCAVCGDQKTHGHHGSYAVEDRLKVVWLCPKHHPAAHDHEPRR